MRSTETFEQAVRARLTPAAGQWLDDAMAQAATGSLDQLLGRYTAASRTLGDARLEGVAGTALGPDWMSVPLDRWTHADAGRALMLLARAGTLRGQAFAADAASCFEQGDAREQESWLRAVGLLPDPAGFLPIVIDACRSNILPVFEAVACENPYPSRFFPEPNFNQMVLKALFNGVALARVVGLEARANGNLARMATDYAAERRAAGRSVPADLHVATGTPGTS
jgi:hypothetical protein